MVESVTQIESGISLNDDVSVKTSYMWKDYIWNPATWRCENGKYLAIIIGDYVWWNYKRNKKYSNRF